MVLGGANTQMLPILNGGAAVTIICLSGVKAKRKILDISDRV